jgi:hypothetical protein
MPETRCILQFHTCCSTRDNEQFTHMTVNSLIHSVNLNNLLVESQKTLSALVHVPVQWEKLNNISNTKTLTKI